MILALLASRLKSSPAFQATMLTVLVFSVVFGGVYWLRRDARVQAAQQCASEKEVAGLRLELQQQKLVAAAHAADARSHAAAVESTSQQLAASDEALAKAQADAELLRKKMAPVPGESDVVYGVGDEWLSRRVRPSGSSSTAPGRSR